MHVFLQTVSSGVQPDNKPQARSGNHRKLRYFSKYFIIVGFQKHLSCKHLAAQSLYEAKMYPEALGLLDVDFEWKDLPAKSSIDSNLSLPSHENVQQQNFLIKSR